MTVSKAAASLPRPAIASTPLAPPPEAPQPPEAQLPGSNVSTFDDTRPAKNALPMFGSPAGGAALPDRPDLKNLIGAQRLVAQAGGSGAGPSTRTVKISTAADVAKASGLDLSRYSAKQLAQLDVVTDGKLDANEAKGIVRFADADDDGKISKQEQLALDFVVGKDTSIEAQTAFVELHEGRIDDRGNSVAREVAAAEKGLQRKDSEHYALVDLVHKQEADMRSAMSAEGFTWTEETPKQITAQMADLRKAGQGSGRKMEELEWRLQYAEMRQTNKAELATTYGALESAKKVLADAKVENLGMQALTKAAKGGIDNAVVEVARFQASNQVADLAEIRGAVETDPKVRGAFVKYAKAAAILNAARDGKLDIDEVDVDKVKDDIKASRKVIGRQTAKLEKAAEQAVKLLEDPKFQARLDKLPEEERTELLTDLHSMISDTEAGYGFFKNNIWPGIEGKSPKNPAIYDDLKVGRHSMKLAVNLTGVWGARIAAEGGKNAMKLMDAQLARSIGVSPDKMSKVYEAVEIANTRGEEAAKKFLKDDPELKALSGKFTLVASGIAFATATLAAHDLIKDPNLRNALGATKSAAEVTEVLSRFKSVPTSIARYAKFAGKVGPPLDVIIGGYDGYKAVKRGDVAGAIGGFTQSAGGVAGTAGLIAAAAGATGVGLPLAAVGAAVAVLGSLVSTLWGDSPTEKWLKDNAPEYLK